MTLDLTKIHELIASSTARLITIVGPTCSGKTALSLALAQKLQLPIINADSRLIYADMNIGSAKPNSTELALAPHYLINLKQVNQGYSSSEYRDDFDKTMEKFSRAIVVGGTGLYIKTAIANLDLPPYAPNPELRAKLAKYSIQELQELLTQLDSNALSQIDKNNPLRLIRAIEITSQSNKPLAQSIKTKKSDRYSALYIGVNFNKRETLYNLIDQRVIAMIEQGLIEETQNLIDRFGITRALTSTIGYREIVSFLNNEISKQEAIELIQKRTRNYAKRQLTWFRAQPNINWFYHDAEVHT